MSTRALFTIGKVTGVHGLNGNLRVWSFAESIDTFGCDTIVLLQAEDGRKTEYSVRKVTPQKKGILLSLDGVDSRTLAENLVGWEILIDREQLPEPDDDSWYWQDLIGLKVIDELKGEIGKITDIFPTGANDVLVVTSDSSTGESKETLVPMHKNFVASVDLEKQTMTTTLPEDYE